MFIVLSWVFVPFLLAASKSFLGPTSPERYISPNPMEKNAGRPASPAAPFSALSGPGPCRSPPWGRKVLFSAPDQPDGRGVFITFKPFFMHNPVFFIFRRALWRCLLLMALVLPQALWAQTIAISGPTEACAGEMGHYVPAVSNAAYNYQWSVTPAVAGAVSFGNASGCDVQWGLPGGATLQLTVRDPFSNNAVIYTGSYAVSVVGLPHPHVTANVNMGCQPLSRDNATSGAKPEFDDEDCQLVCENATVTYTAHGGDASTYGWQVVGAVSYSVSGNVCDVEWGSTGFGEVRLSETNANGCTTEISFCVEIMEGPKARFRPLPTSAPNPFEICMGGTLVLEDMSLPSSRSPIVSYLWEWGDGQETHMSPGAQSTTASHVYDAPGEYKVYLTVTDACGCSNTVEYVITVLDAKAPKISCPAVVCHNDIVSYRVDKPCSASSWSIEGGTILAADPARLDVRWDNVDPNTGFGRVYYQSCDPCPMTVVEEVPVVVPSVTVHGPSVLCEGESYVYRVPKWPSTQFAWFVSGSGVLDYTGQPNEIVVRATGAGPITLICKYRNTLLNCGDSTFKVLSVGARAVMDGPSRVCQNSLASYSVGGLLGEWTLLDAQNNVIITSTGVTFNHFFSQAGSFMLRVQGADFCPPKDFVINVVRLPRQPDSISGPPRACPGIPVRYEGGGPIAGTTFEWSVAGGLGTVNAMLGDYTYVQFSSVPAVVRAVRITTDGAGCRSAAIEFPVSTPVPALSISGKAEVCHSTQESYSANYTDGDIYEWSIVPSDLGSVVQNNSTFNPTVLWNVPPLSTGAWATLTAKIKKCGSDHFVSYSVFVKGIPEIVSVSLSPNDTICSGTPVTLDIATNYPVTSADMLLVEWGDGTSTSLPFYTPTVDHIYSTVGTAAPVAFTPSISIVAPNGCAGTISGQVSPITVMPQPTAFLSPSGPIKKCGSGWTETLYATVTTGIGGTNTFDWSPPAAAFGSMATINDYGDYTVTVTNSVFGCSGTSNVVRVAEDCGGNPSGCPTAPIFSLSADTAHCGDDITVESTFTGPYYDFQWIVPPGLEVVDASTPQTLKARATAGGSYTVQCLVYSSAGCYRMEAIDVLVPYVPDLRHSIGCEPSGGAYRITLYDHTTQYPGTPVTARRFYRSPGTLLAAGPGGLQAVVTQAGNTTVEYFEVVQRTGLPACTSYVSVATPFYPSVGIALKGGVPNPGCVNDVVFRFDIIALSGSIMGYMWDYNNAKNYSIEGAAVYTAPGNKTVKLTVTDLHGCQATGQVGIDVRLNDYRGATTAVPNPVCQGQVVQLGYQPDLLTLSPNSYIWYEQQRPLAATVPANYGVLEPGGYWALGLGDHGCLVKARMEVVQVHQVPQVRIMGSDRQCMNQPFVLRAPDYGPGYTYAWGGAGSGTGPSLEQELSFPGTYTYYVELTDQATGCVSRSPDFQVIVSAPPGTPALSYDVLSCDPYLVELTASGPAGAYTWSHGAEGPVAETRTGGAYRVELVDLNGCRSEGTMDVPRSLQEYMWFFPTGCFCTDRPGGGEVLGPYIQVANWAWLRNGGVTASGNGAVASLSVSPGNVYNLYLDDGHCDLTSGDMHYVDSNPCPPMRPASVGDALVQDGDRDALSLAPNPARGNSMVRYRFAPGGSGARTIELTDALGRKLRAFEPDRDEGSLELSMQGLAPGLYQVTMLRGGKPLRHAKLSLVD